MSDFQEKLLAMIMSGLLVVSVLALSHETAEYVQSQRAVGVASETVRPVDKTHRKACSNIPCVVLDAGHGGSDPGKVGINGAEEKAINLAIVLRLKQFLEANDVRVVLTRENDAGLYDEDSDARKAQDMKRRVTVIEEAEAALAVSVHQNSYPEEYVHGAQVFYYENSKEGQKLAQVLQTNLAAYLDPGNTRQIKANDSYYLLKKTKLPIVIAECGFLSNAEEAQKLCDPLYQERIAWALHMGILRYLNNSGSAFDTNMLE